MLDIFSSLQSVAKSRQKKVTIDNLYCQLHYKVTVMILVGSALLVTVNVYVQKPIRCVVDESIGNAFMNLYCWIHSTYTIPGKMQLMEAAHPGVASANIFPPGAMDDTNSPTDTVRFHRYYQWVVFVLLFQSIFFFLPRYMWKLWEGGRIKMFLMDLNNPAQVEEQKNKKKDLVVHYFMANMGRHNFYAARFFLCEIIYFVNVLGQIFFTDMFLDYEFIKYGSQMIGFTSVGPTEDDPIQRVFPQVTKCTFKKYGPSGNVIDFDGICVLPLNIINEKIYLFLWCWFFLLTIISGLALVYRVITLVMPTVRVKLLQSKARLVDSKYLNLVCGKRNIGDWFILYQIGKQMDGSTFQELLNDLARLLDRRANI